MADAEPRARTLFVSLGDEQGHALAILRAGLEEPHRVALALEPGSAPRLEDGERVERDPVAIARALGGRPDQRLFPTLFRHDAVYSSHLRLNAARVRDFPRLADWLARMRAWPGVSEASDLDRARNGYFGRSSNEIVPAGPTPLGLSPKDHPRAVWLDEPSESP